MKELTKAEEQIMHIIWKNEPMITREIIDLLPNPKPAYTTVGTFLKILERKGFVGRKPIANTYQYFALVDKEVYTRTFLKKFIGNYFEGSTKSLVSFFINENDLSLSEFEDLRNQLKNKND